MPRHVWRRSAAPHHARVHRHRKPGHHIPIASPCCAAIIIVCHHLRRHHHTRHPSSAGCPPIGCAYRRSWLHVTLGLHRRYGRRLVPAAGASDLPTPSMDMMAAPAEAAMEAAEGAGAAGSSAAAASGAIPSLASAFCPFSPIASPCSSPSSPPSPPPSSRRSPITIFANEKPPFWVHGAGLGGRAPHGFEEPSSFPRRQVWSPCCGPPPQRAPPPRRPSFQPHPRSSSSRPPRSPFLARFVLVLILTKELELDGRDVGEQPLKAVRHDVEAIEQVAAEGGEQPLVRAKEAVETVLVDRQRAGDAARSRCRRGRRGRAGR